MINGVIENKSVVDISWQILLSGFIGTIVGAVISVIGAIFLANRNEKARRKDSLRIILAELKENLEVADKARPDTPLKFNMSGWNVSKGATLSLKDATVPASLLKAYSLMGRVNVIVDRMIADRGSAGSGTWNKKYETATAEAKRATEEAINKLSPLLKDK